MPVRASLSLLLLLGCSTAHATEHQSTSNDALRKSAQKEVTAAISTLEDLVNIESGSNDHQGLTKISNYLASRLKQLGATVDHPIAAGDKAPIVRGRLMGTGALRIMLIAHMDTVYDKGILLKEPYHRDGNIIYGPGIADDKGGLAVILHSLALLKKSEWMDYAQLTVLFNADEEIGSPGSGETIANLAAEHDVVLSFEPSPAKAVIRSEGVLLSAAGTSQVVMTVNGLTSHAGAAPEQGRNALLELASRLLQTQAATEQVSGTQLNWTMANAGTARNQIPGTATAIGDLRVTAVDANERLASALERMTATPSMISDTTTSVSVEPLRPMYVAGERGSAIAERARAIYAELDGRELLFHPATNGGTDAGFAGRSGKAAVLEGLGLAGWGYHAKKEFIEVDSIEPRLYLAARLMIELGSDASNKK